MNEDSFLFKIVMSFTIGLGVFGSALILSLICSIPAWLSWNYVIPYLFGLKTISWLQAWALCLLGSAIFKSSLTQKV